MLVSDEMYLVTLSQGIITLLITSYQGMEGSSFLGDKFMAIVFGIVSAVLCIVAFDSINLLVYPPPKDFSYDNTEMAKQFLFSAPLYAKLVIIAGLVVAGLVGGMVAAKFDKSADKRTGLIVGGLLFVQYVVNFISIPYPAVIIVSGLALVIPASYYGYQLFVKYFKRETKA